MSEHEFQIDPEHHNKRRTLCEVLREIHRASADRPEIQALVADAFDKAKRMNRRLKEYKAKEAR